VPGGLFMLPKQNHLGVFPEKPVQPVRHPGWRRPALILLQPLQGKSNGFSEKKFALL
uniref:Uncharacterized protein n=1 Tax=Urocitellus parryii TaxID=9999 RepID=A0A8D2KGH1_UROPR